MLGDFPRAFSLLLEFIECSALSRSNEVSLAALKSFQEILYNKPPTDASATDVVVKQEKGGSSVEDIDIWNVSYGRACVCVFIDSCLIYRLRGAYG
jgi:hypothetical protein